LFVIILRSINLLFTGLPILYSPLGYFDTLTIKSGCCLSANGWDQKRGGVLVLVAREMTIEKGGRVNAMGCGYWGGKGAMSFGQPAYQGESWSGSGKGFGTTNGGGGGGGGSASSVLGGANFGIGGGGGGYFTPGFNAAAYEYAHGAGVTIGQGGEAYEPFTLANQGATCVVLGSGGGGGGCPSRVGGRLANGGNGGGAIIIRAHTLRNDGLISASGYDGTMRQKYASGGGGSGGLVLIVAEHVVGEGRIEAVGGSGAVNAGDLQNHTDSQGGDLAALGGGGDGGDGHIVIRTTDMQSIREMKITCEPRCQVEENLNFPNVLSSLTI
jgi:hypothetical protein